jgi:hypothetical protein
MSKHLYLEIQALESDIFLTSGERKDKNRDKMSDSNFITRDK